MNNAFEKNTIWQPEFESIPQLNNQAGKTWAEIFDEYNIDGIPFINGQPVFDAVCIATVEIDSFTENRAENYLQADYALAEKWTAESRDSKSWTEESIRNLRKESELTWHEKEDRKTMQLMPTIIHNNVPHYK